MKITRYDELQFNEWAFRFGPPMLAWALVFTFFALAGSASHREPTQAADGATAVGPIEDDAAAAATVAAVITSAGEPELRDPAVVAHEALDPVGVGRAPADDPIARDFSPFALNALLVPLLDDAEPPR